MAYKCTKIHRQAISDALKGYKHTDEAKEKLRITSTGLIKSAETRELISKKLTGRVLKKSTKNKMRISALKRWKLKKEKEDGRNQS